VKRAAVAVEATTAAAGAPPDTPGVLLGIGDEVEVCVAEGGRGGGDWVPVGAAIALLAGVAVPDGVALLPRARVVVVAVSSWTHS
jgi:hypothetical protein